MPAVRLAALALLLAVAGCGTTPEIATRPSPYCDFRVVDLNERLCASAGKIWIAPTPDAPCGACR